MNKIIFLDIDGVVNLVPQGRDEYGAIWHSHLVENLKTVIDATGAKVVVSSSWRYNGLIAMQEMWKLRGLPGEVIDITPIFQHFPHLAEFKDLPFKERGERGHEINEWLKLNPVDSYVIFDDDTDMLPEQMKYFVKTSENTHHEDCVDIGYGLTKECAQMAIEILNSKK